MIKNPRHGCPFKVKASHWLISACAIRDRTCGPGRSPTLTLYNTAPISRRIVPGGALRSRTMGCWIDTISVLD